MDTIFAVSSGMPPAAIAIVRVSGSGALAAATRLAGTLPQPRRAALRGLRHPRDGNLLDRALVLVFPGPDSATGEDLVELHLHGGRAVVRAVEDALGSLAGLRRAEAGEFTRRALASGRIDLTEAEGLGDLLMAETEAQRRAALGSAEGAVSRLIERWTTRLLDTSAGVEAQLDYADEAEVAEDIAAGGLLAAAGDLADEIEAALARPPVERLRDGIRVILAGPPNAGKSTLFNALVEREAAIVSPVAGTTRDVIEAPLVRNGIAYLLVDTAGLAEASNDPVERIGIARAGNAIASGDVVLWLGDPAAAPAGRTICVHPRADLPGRGSGPAASVMVAAETGLGLDDLWAAIESRSGELLVGQDQVLLNARQRDLAAAAADNLRSAAYSIDLVLAAEELRRARTAFDAVTGKSGTEQMLDALFSRFCIGK